MSDSRIFCLFYTHLEGHM